MWDTDLQMQESTPQILVVDDELIKRAILAMTRSLGIKAVTEGIETREQVQMLKDLQCSLGQGYYLSRPLDEKSADTFLQKHNMGSARQEKGSK